MTTIVKRNGLQDKFRIDKVERTILKNMEGIPYVNLEKVMEEFMSNAYTGMSTKELLDTLILCCTSLIEEAPEYEVLAAKFLLQKINKEASH